MAVDAQASGRSKVADFRSLGPHNRSANNNNEAACSMLNLLDFGAVLEFSSFNSHARWAQAFGLKWVSGSGQTALLRCQKGTMQLKAANTGHQIEA